jgi:hypothetical protein
VTIFSSEHNRFVRSHPGPRRPLGVHLDTSDPWVSDVWDARDSNKLYLTGLITAAANGGVVTILLTGGDDPDPREMNPLAPPLEFDPAGFQLPYEATGSLDDLPSYIQVAVAVRAGGAPHLRGEGALPASVTYSLTTEGV